MAFDIPPDFSKAELLRRIDNGWAELRAYIETLSPEQLAGPTDAAGWTAKDHIIHLAIWEDGVHALLSGEPRRERMGIDEAMWEGHDYDTINAVIQQRHKAISLDEALQRLDEAHRRLLDKIETLSEEDLVQPCSHFQPSSSDRRPVFGVIAGNTFGHYEEHIPWMQAIVGQ